MPLKLEHYLIVAVAIASPCCQSGLAHYEFSDDSPVEKIHSQAEHHHDVTRQKKNLEAKRETKPEAKGQAKGEAKPEAKRKAMRDTRGDSSARSSADVFDPWKLLELAITPAYAMASNVTMNVEGSYRVLRANGIPNHQTGAFPNAGNPNSMSEQRYTFRMPAMPVSAGVTTALGMYPFGVALNGVPFDPGAAEWWNNDPYSGWQYEAMSLGPRLGLDQNNAHVQPGGAYHYHGIPTGLLDKLPRNVPVQLGYAADGFPIYAPYGYADPANSRSVVRKLRTSYRLKGGGREGGPGGSHDGSFVQDYEYVRGLGDLDDCNGRFGVTPEYPRGTYHYVITENFPYIPRGFKGTPDVSFQTRGGSRPGPAGGPGFGRFGPGVIRGGPGGPGGPGVLWGPGGPGGRLGGPGGFRGPGGPAGFGPGVPGGPGGFRGPGGPGGFGPGVPGGPGGFSPGSGSGLNGSPGGSGFRSPGEDRDLQPDPQP